MGECVDTSSFPAYLKTRDVLVENRVNDPKRFSSIANRTDSSVLTQDIITKLPHPWLIIEDAHRNLVNVLEHFYVHMTSGDYMVVEDGHPEIVYNSGKSIAQDKGDNYERWGENNARRLREFVQRHPAELKIDTYYNDRFGHNFTWNVNGFLRRM